MLMADAPPPTARRTRADFPEGPAGDLEFAEYERDLQKNMKSQAASRVAKHDVNVRGGVGIEETQGIDASKLGAALEQEVDAAELGVAAGKGASARPVPGDFAHLNTGGFGGAKAATDAYRAAVRMYEADPAGYAKMKADQARKKNAAGMK